VRIDLDFAYRLAWGQKGDCQMKSNFERLTSLFLVASAVALVGKISPAHARHLPEHSLAVVAASNPVFGETRRRHRARRMADSHHRRHSQRARHQHLRTNLAMREDIRFVDGGGMTRDPFGNDRVAWSERAPVARRRSRLANLGKSPAGGGVGGSDLVAEARRWIGTNPTGWSHVWCGRFMNFVLERTGRRGSGSNLARSFASYGSRVGGPQIGAIAVMGRGGHAAGGSPGGHVGVVSGIDSNGNPIIISGNHGHRVAEAVYPRSRIFAYVIP
jgi:uncharacterized protein (TIGR02594 family)